MTYGYTQPDAYRFGALLHEGASARAALQVRVQQKFGRSNIADLSESEIAWIRREMDGLLYDFSIPSYPGIVPLKTLKNVRMKYPGHEGVRILKVHPDEATRWFCTGLANLPPKDAAWNCLSGLLFNPHLAAIRNRGNVFIPEDLEPLYSRCCVDENTARFHLICIDIPNDDNATTITDDDDDTRQLKNCIPWCVTYREWAKSVSGNTIDNLGHVLLCDVSHIIAMTTNEREYTALTGDVVQMAVTHEHSAKNFLHDLSSKYFKCPWNDGDERSVRYDDMKKQLGIPCVDVHLRVMTPWYRPQRIWLRGTSRSSSKISKTLPSSSSTDKKKYHTKVLSDVPDKLRLAVSHHDTHDSVFGGNRDEWVEDLIRGLQVDYYCRGQNPKGRDLHYYRGTATFDDGSVISFDKVDTVSRLLKRVIVQLKDKVGWRGGGVEG